MSRTVDGRVEVGEVVRLESLLVGSVSAQVKPSLMKDEGITEQSTGKDSR